MTTVQTPSGLRTITRQSPLGSESPVRTVGNAGRVPLLRGDLVGTYEAMYKNQLWVWVLVNKIMRGISRLPWKTFEYLDDARQQVQRVRVHPLTDLINNPWPRAGAWHLKEAISGGLLIHGNSVFYKYRSGPGAPPSQLWALPWRNVDVVHDNFIPLYYVFRGVHDRIALLPEDIVHFRLWGGGGPIGISPLEPLRRTLALEDAAQEYSARYMDNAATPSALFHTDKNIKKESTDRLRAELDLLYGGLQNAGRFAVLGDGFQVTPLQHNLVDTDLIRQRQLNREEVAAAYDVAPPIVGILDRATFNNVEELHGMLYTDTLPPWAQLIETTVHTQLRDGEPMFEGVFTEFDFSQVLQGSPEKRSAAYQRWFQSATYSPNELRRADNLAPIGDATDPENPANQIWVPLNMLPVGAAREEIEARAAASRGMPTFEAPASEPSKNGKAKHVPAL